MKKLSYNFRIFIITSLFLGTTLALCGPAFAKWYYNAGTSGNLQEESVLARATIYYGWGMDFEIKAFNGTWAHIPVPLPYKATKGVDKIFVEVQVSGTAGFVDEVDVYSGGAKIHEFLNLDWYEGNHAVVLNMGAVKNVFGPISISIWCATGDGSSRFIIKRVGANVKRK